MNATQVWLPTLSQSGNIKDPDTIMLQLFKYFIASDHSQTTLMSRDDIYSLKYIIGNTNTEPELFASTLEKELTKFYNNYFSNTSVTVTLTSNPDETSLYQYKVDISVYSTDGLNGPYTLSKILALTDNGEVSNFQELLGRYITNI